MANRRPAVARAAGRKPIVQDRQMPSHRKGRGRDPAPIIVASLFAALAPAFAYAQVIEIGAGGGVTTYDGPAVFTDAGAAPIATRQKPRPANPTALASALSSAAETARISQDLIATIVWRESRGRPGLVSPAGAVGEMQLMPGTAALLGVDARKTDQNVLGGAEYLSLLMKHYNGDLIRSLAAYNAGPGAVDRYGGVPPFKETQTYVAAVLDRLSDLALAGNDDRR